MGGAGIELLFTISKKARALGFFPHLAEIHALHTLASKSWTNRRTGTRLDSAYDQLDNLVACRQFARHVESFVVACVKISR